MATKALYYDGESPQVAAVPSSSWSYGLLDCCSDSKQCADIMCCFYCKFGYMAYRLEHNDAGFNAPLCLMMCMCNHFLGLQCAPGINYQFRKAIILRYNLPHESFCQLCWTSLLCTCCSMVQQAREMDVRGEACGGICAKPPAAYAPLV